MLILSWYLPPGCSFSVAERIVLAGPAEDGAAGIAAKGLLQRMLKYEKQRENRAASAATEKAPVYCCRYDRGYPRFVVAACLVRRLTGRSLVSLFLASRLSSALHAKACSCGYTLPFLPPAAAAAAPASDFAAKQYGLRYSITPFRLPAASTPSHTDNGAAAPAYTLLALNAALRCRSQAYLASGFSQVDRRLAARERRHKRLKTAGAGSAGAASTLRQRRRGAAVAPAHAASLHSPRPLFHDAARIMDKR